jgi:hypothetical protein
MNKLIISSILFFGVGLSAPPPVQAQGTLYLSNLEMPSTGAAPVGSDSWLGMDFLTGTNAGGYLLNSVQFALGNASGNPSGFTAMIYASGNIPIGDYIGHNIGTLNGSLDPVAAGIYTFSPASDLILSPGTEYYLVLTAGTPIADGTYNWSYTDTFPPTQTGGWLGGSYFATSTDGTYGGLPPQLRGHYAQFGINATELPVPEPSTFFLLVLGGLWLLHRKRRR